MVNKDTQNNEEDKAIRDDEPDQFEKTGSRTGEDDEEKSEQNNA
ncbi:MULTISPECIES: hypothetical protein [unclassified Paenibacillus]|uniref:Uncharacterized protein n=1 Tax=Paenibacillus provencensis TaxID=441151 RepID=A0ABW3PZY9_9BACL|nr:MULTISPECIES: hypothetical protein [unclassified Paenibacillus]SFS77295.1 hypothetical protein SAMN04488601_103146 [Paenibacillus sp. 453mf]